VSIKQVLHEGLDAAVCAHMGKLFGVLMTDPGDEALERFERGLENLIRMYKDVLVLINAQEGK
jgi:hypothetical protein